VPLLPSRRRSIFRLFPITSNQASRSTRGSASCAILRHQHKASGRSSIELLEFVKCAPKVTEKPALTAPQPLLPPQNTYHASAVISPTTTSTACCSLDLGISEATQPAEFNGKAAVWVCPEFRIRKLSRPKSVANRGRVGLQTLESEPPFPQMPDKTYLIRFKPSDLSPHVVIAANPEIHGEHLVFRRSDGSLAALFVLEVVESWAEVDPSGL
jgi:hypothetical protein